MIYFYPQLVQLMKRIGICKLYCAGVNLLEIINFNLFEILKIYIVFHFGSMILHRIQN